MTRNVFRDPVFWKAVLAVVLFFLFIIVYANEFEYFNRTINARQLVIPAVIVGLCLGVIAGWYYQRRQTDPVVRLQIVMACLFAGLIAAPLAGSLSNRLLSPHPTRFQEVDFVKEQPFYSSRFGVLKGESQMPTGYYLFFYYKDKLRRISLDQSFFEATEEGEPILVPFKKGLWGIELVRPSKLTSSLNSQES